MSLQRMLKLNLKRNSETGTKRLPNESWYCHPCGEIVPIHKKRPIRCKKCSQGYIEKVDKEQLMTAIADNQQPEPIFQPAFDRTEQPVLSLLVNSNGVIVNPNEMENKAKLAESNVKTQFPAREATSDITNPQVNLQPKHFRNWHKMIWSYHMSHMTWTHSI